MNAIIDPHVVSSLRDALDILDAAERVLAETIGGSVLDNRTEVAEARAGLLVVREFLASMAGAADGALPARGLVPALGGVAVAAVAGSGVSDPRARFRRRRALEDAGIVAAAFGLLAAEFAGLPLPWILWGLLVLGAVSYVAAGLRWWRRKRRAL